MGLRRLVPDDAEAYRAVSLQAYAEAADAFTATRAEREPLPLDWWARRLRLGLGAPERVLGAFDGDALVGVAGLRRGVRPRTAHKAALFGLAVLDSHRGRSLGRALVEAVVAEAAASDGVVVVGLTVTEPNRAARALYASCGFRAFGVEPLAVRMGDRFVPLVHMARRV